MPPAPARGRKSNSSEAAARSGALARPQIAFTGETALFKNLRIGVRLTIGFGLVLALLAIIAGLGISRMAGIKDKLDTVVNENNVKIAAANAMRGQINVIARAVRNLAMTSDAATMKTEAARIQDARGKYAEQRDKLQKMIKSEEARKIMADINDGQKKTTPLVEKAMDLALASKNEQATSVIMTEVRGPQSKWIDDINAMIERQEQQNRQFFEQSGEDYNAAVRLMIGLSLAAMALGGLMAYLITRGITRPLGEAVAAANRLAEGDLAVQLEATSRDETGQLIRAMGNMARPRSRAPRPPRNSPPRPRK